MVLIIPILNMVLIIPKNLIINNIFIQKSTYITKNFQFSCGVLIYIHSSIMEQLEVITVKRKEAVS